MALSAELVGFVARRRWINAVGVRAGATRGDGKLEDGDTGVAGAASGEGAAVGASGGEACGEGKPEDGDIGVAGAAAGGAGAGAAAGARLSRLEDGGSGKTCGDGTLDNGAVARQGWQKLIQQGARELQQQGWPGESKLEAQ